MSSIGTFHAQGLHNTMPAKSGVNMKNFERQKFGAEKVQKLQQKSSILASKFGAPLVKGQQAEMGQLKLPKIINSIEEKSQTKEEGGTGSQSAILSPIGSSRMGIIQPGSVFQGKSQSSRHQKEIDEGFE